MPVQPSAPRACSLETRSARRSTFIAALAFAPARQCRRVASGGEIQAVAHSGGSLIIAPRQPANYRLRHCTAQLMHPVLMLSDALVLALDH